MSTYDVNAPNANQSPSLFPAQANGNFDRLKAIVNAEHNFTDSFVTNQGCHKQVTFINRTGNPSFVSGTNAILYTQFDANNESQLFYYNGALRSQLTPYNQLLPIKVVSTNVLISGTDVAVYPNPGFDYVGVAHIVNDSTHYSFYQIIKYQGTVAFRLDFVSNRAPTIFFTGADLYIKNNFVGGPSETFKTSLIINRIT